MKALNILVCFMVLLAAISCANFLSPASRTEYWKGYDTAEAFAKKDAVDSGCFGYSGIGRSRRRINVERRTQKYTKELQEQGRSETFIKGFQFAYEESYYQSLELYCGW